MPIIFLSVSSLWIKETYVSKSSLLQDIALALEIIKTDITKVGKFIIFSTIKWLYRLYNILKSFLMTSCYYFEKLQFHIATCTILKWFQENQKKKKISHEKLHPWKKKMRQCKAHLKDFWQLTCFHELCLASIHQQGLIDWHLKLETWYKQWYFCCGFPIIFIISFSLQSIFRNFTPQCI